MVSPERKPPGTRACAVALALLLLGCTSSPPADPAPRLLWIDIDAADWHDIDPLVAAGRLPNLASLVRRGMRGPLASVTRTPRAVVSLQSVSLATGTTFEKHGITEAQFFDPPTEEAFVADWESARTKVGAQYHGPVQTGMRRTPAIWNILGSRGIRVGVAGWWATWPAEPVNGYLVSSFVKNRMPWERIDDFSEARRRHLQLTFTGTVYAGGELRQTYPEDFAREIGPILERAEAVPDQEILKLLPGLALAPSRSAFFDIKWNQVANEIFCEVALQLLRKTDVQAVFVVMHGVDAAYHRDPNDLLGQYYDYIDRRLGDLLAAAGSETTVLVTSEHGTFGPTGHDRGPTNGIIVVAGKRVGTGELRGAGTLDVVPTVLALLDQAAPANLDGRVLESVFTDDARRTRRWGDVEEVEWSPPAILTSFDLSRFDRAIDDRLDRIGYPREQGREETR